MSRQNLFFFFFFFSPKTQQCNITVYKKSTIFIGQLERHLYIYKIRRKELFFRRCLAWPRERSNLVFAGNLRRHSRDPAKHLAGPLGRVSGRQHVAPWTVQHGPSRFNELPPQHDLTGLASVHTPRSKTQIASPVSKFTWSGWDKQKTLSNDVSIHVTLQDSWHRFRPLVLCQRRPRNANHSTCAFTVTLQWMSHADSIVRCSCRQYWCAECQHWALSLISGNELASFKLLRSP